MSDKSKIEGQRDMESRSWCSKLALVALIATPKRLADGFVASLPSFNRFDLRLVPKAWHRFAGAAAEVL